MMPKPQTPSPLAALMREQRAAQAPVELIPAIDSTPVESIPPVIHTRQPLQITPDVNSIPPIDSTPVKRGFLRVPNQLIDNILPTLKPAEQSVLLRLFRLSHGFGKTTCSVSLKSLATACFMSESATRFAVRNVEGRGYIKQIGVDNTNSNQLARGIMFDVLPGLVAPSESKPPVDSRTGVESKPIKENLKIIKKGDAPLCPKCKNTGWFYPEGVAKGVKKCDHAD
jgi:hypothetical protein